MRLTEIGPGRTAMAEIDGIGHAVDVSLLEAPQVGQYVIVHAGFAIEILALFAEITNAAGERP
jgi:hydrogenase assembly chaperone HypC/HupF